MTENYRPLPDYLTIMPSKIEGLGLFAIKEIPAEKSLGLTHIWKWDEPNHYLRTPLGGFINHSDNPNCYLITKSAYTGTKFLYTKEVIPPLTELTLKYSLYEV